MKIPNFVKFIKPKRSINFARVPFIRKHDNILGINNGARELISSEMIDIFYDKKLNVIDIRPGNYKKLMPTVWCPYLPLPNGIYERDEKGYYVLNKTI